MGKSTISMVIFNSYVKLSEGKHVSGCWYTYPSEKYDFVSWNDDIPNWMGKS